MREARAVKGFCFAASHVIPALFPRRSRFLLPSFPRSRPRHSRPFLPRHSRESGNPQTNNVILAKAGTSPPPEIRHESRATDPLSLHGRGLGRGRGARKRGSAGETPALLVSNTPARPSRLRSALCGARRSRLPPTRANARDTLILAFSHKGRRDPLTARGACFRLPYPLAHKGAYRGGHLVRIRIGGIIGFSGFVRRAS